MAQLHRFWNDVWPVVATMSGIGLPAFGWQHWRISIKLSRHQAQITATLDKKLKIKVEVDPAGPVTISPASTEPTEPQ